MTSLSRRRLLTTGAAAGLGVAAGVGVDRTLFRESQDENGTALHGEDTIAFHGRHQAGIATAPTAHAVFLAMDLKPEVDRSALTRMMRVLSDDAARLTQGDPSLADTEPELAHTPSRLTVTFGFGPEFVKRAKGRSPVWLRPLPSFEIDQLEDRWSGGDLLLQVSSEDPLVVSHAVRVLLKDARGFASVRWRQSGFRRASGTDAPGTTMRNLFGQVDGTVNPAIGTPDFDTTVWCTDGWWAGGTGFVLRRIAMDLEGWDQVGRAGREASIGRRLGDGSPLTGEREHDQPDLEARNAIGLPVISDFAHLRRAQTDDPTQVILRRPYNYDDAPSGSEVSNSGLLFASFQADIDHQFVPLQQRLSDLDLLNEWTTPIGSSVFVIPPGCAEGGFVGETLLT